METKFADWSFNGTFSLGPNDLATRYVEKIGPQPAQLRMAPYVHNDSQLSSIKVSLRAADCYQERLWFAKFPVSGKQGMRYHAIWYDNDTTQMTHASTNFSSIYELASNQPDYPKIQFNRLKSSKVLQTLAICYRKRDSSFLMSNSNVQILGKTTLPLQAKKQLMIRHRRFRININTPPPMEKSRRSPAPLPRQKRQRSPTDIRPHS